MEIRKGENIGEPGDIEFKKEELDESKKMTPDMKYIRHTPQKRLVIRVMVFINIIIK